jgi:hypothetical protein
MTGGTFVSLVVAAATTRGRPNLLVLVLQPCGHNVNVGPQGPAMQVLVLRTTIARERVAGSPADHLHIVADAAVEQRRETRILDLQLDAEELDAARTLGCLFDCHHLHHTVDIDALDAPGEPPRHMYRARRMNGRPRRHVPVTEATARPESFTVAVVAFDWYDGARPPTPARAIQRMRMGKRMGLALALAVAVAVASAIVIVAAGAAVMGPSDSRGSQANDFR